MKVFGIFEGGGVRGYAHIGALRALQRRGIEFEAVAGTSIGAIAAVLVAAGCPADALYDGEGEGIAAAPLSTFFSQTDLAILNRLQKDRDACQWIMRHFRRCKLPSLLDSRSPITIILLAWLTAPFVWICAPVVFWRYRKAISSLWRQFGLFNTTAAYDWLDGALRHRLGKTDLPRKLIFGDLEIPLRVIVSDVATGNMRVAGADLNEPLVEAVIASASFPLFFMPSVSTGGFLVDGGILSNLPAWVFDRQRAAATWCIPTIALRLESPETTSGYQSINTLARFVPRLLATILAGARELQFRRIDEHHLISLRADVKPLAFDKMEAERSALVAAGERAVDAYFDSRFGPADPARATALLQTVAAHVRQALGTSAVVRAWILTVADEEYLRIAYAANMAADDADDQLLVRRTSPGVASAFSRKEPVLVNVPAVVKAFGRDPRYKYEHAIRAEAVVTICGLPIFADPAEWGRAPQHREVPIAVLGLDLDEDARLAFLSVQVEDRLAAYAQLVGEMLRNREVTPFVSGGPLETVLSASSLLEIHAGVEVYERKIRALPFDEDVLRLVSEARFSIFPGYGVRASAIQAEN